MNLNTIKVVLIFSCLQLTVFSQKQVSVANFGALPNDTLNDREAIQKAVDYCRINKVTKLIIPSGKYIIAEPNAIQLMNDIMDGKMGENPQNVIYTPYYPYTKGVLFDHVTNLEVIAEGANFFARGWMEPISIWNCKNLTIKGLTLDYENMPHSEGKIIHKTDSYFDAKFSDEFPVKSNMVMPRIMFYDMKKNRIRGTSVYFPTKNELIDRQTLRIYANYNDSIIGDMALINHTFHFRPAIFINESTNIELQQVTIHSQPGMGIVGHRSENLIFNGLRIVPRPGFYQSTNTDATHFTSCKGLIRFDGCMFEGQGDDATNVHGYYQRILRKDAPNTYTIEMEKKWGTHAMMLDFPDKNDTLELVSKSTLEIVDRFQVKKTMPFPEKWNTTLILNKELPSDIENYFLIDVTRLPRLEFVNSYVGSHLARAVLVKTRNVLIENCTMRESTGTAIHIGAEGDWREGPGSSNIVVRNNRILRCGRGDGTNDGACAIAINTKAPNKTSTKIHSNILIEGNLIEGEDAEWGISIMGASNVKVCNNTFSGCKNPIKVQFSENYNFKNNTSKN